MIATILYLLGVSHSLAAHQVIELHARVRTSILVRASMAFLWPLVAFWVLFSLVWSIIEEAITVPNKKLRAKDLKSKPTYRKRPKRRKPTRQPRKKRG